MIQEILFSLSVLILSASGKLDISGGVISREREYPHLVVLREGTRYKCPGGLINNRTILIAAQCLDHVNDFSLLNVQVGTNDISSIDNGQIVFITNTLVHPLWDPAKYDDSGYLINDNDIALLFMAYPLEENGENIRFMDLQEEFELTNPNDVDVAGWGYTHYSTSVSPVLRSVVVPIIEPCVCQVCKEEIQICAGDKQGKDSCPGDAGTPLSQIHTPYDNRFKSVGVLSFGVPSRECWQVGSFGVYTRVSSFIDWIWNNTDKPPQSTFEPLLYIGERFNDLKCFGLRWNETNSCSSHGKCIKNDSCLCDDEYLLPDCSSKVCSRECGAHGVCDWNYTMEVMYCKCNESFGGENCDISICSPSCLNGGTCSSPNVCDCSVDWNGDICQDPICDNPSCTSHGTCTFPDTCSCDSGWSEPDCSTSLCQPECVNGGCVDGRCYCESGWTSDICDEKVCFLECGEHGKCYWKSNEEKMFCLCDEGWNVNKSGACENKIDEEEKLDLKSYLINVCLTAFAGCVACFFSLLFLVGIYFGIGLLGKIFQRKRSIVEMEMAGVESRHRVNKEINVGESESGKKLKKEEVDVGAIVFSNEDLPETGSMKDEFVN